MNKCKQGLPVSNLPLKMYVCGPTVYDRIHLGNARPLVVFDMLFRLLRFLYGLDNVVYVRNITDIDDKIIQRALENGETTLELTARTTAWFKEDSAKLFLLEPTFEPKATENIPQMLELIQKLQMNGLAYVQEGDVFFSVKKDPSYGRIADFKGRQAGARVAVNQNKDCAQDFVLWKKSKPGEPAWESPWGRGRPGWHIECSAMSWRYLGQKFDLHGGGEDLIFPHHENEMAQTCGCFGQDSGAVFWMHNGMLTVEGQKMAKSVSNFITLKQALAKYSGELLRFWILSSHYRGVLAWKDESLTSLAKILDNWRKIARKPSTEIAVDRNFLEALQDDLNTPLAFTRMHELEKEQQFEQLFVCGQLLGLFNQADVDPEFALKVQILLKARFDARQAKNYALADKIRLELEAMAVTLEDKSDGSTSWYKNSVG